MSKYQLRALRTDDLAFAQELRRIAGWNQTDADWQRLLDCGGQGCFLIRCDGQPAGTATTTVFAGRIGWIGMVLVHPSFRRRGLATALVSHCLDYLLNRLRVACVKLDATAQGQQLYGKLGFQTQYTLCRWEGRLPAPPPAPARSPSLCRIEERQWQGCLALDRPVFGADRGDFLRRLARDSRRAIAVADQGFGMLRDGACASYLGPVVALDEPVGRQLVVRLLGHAPLRWTTADQQQSAAAVYWDIPSDNEPAERLAQQLGFVRSRPLVRMWAGPRKLPDDPHRQWAITGPETG